MKLRSYQVQPDHDYRLSFGISRTLLNTLRFPLIWSYDELLGGYIPGEVDFSFLEWVIKNVTPEFNPGDLPAVRLQQLQAAGMIDPDWRLPRETLRQQLSEQGYVRITRLLHPEYVKFLSMYRQRNAHLQGPNKLPLLALIHHLTSSLVQNLVPELIKPSCSITLTHGTTAESARSDHHSVCIYNLSMILDSKADPQKWLLHIQADKVIHHVPLDYGDGVLYSENDPYWRDPLPNEVSSVVESIFHYTPVGVA